MTMTREASTTAAAVPTRLELGGNANFLIAAARLGLRTAAVAHVGGESVGEFAARELETGTAVEWKPSRDELHELEDRAAAAFDDACDDDRSEDFDDDF